MGASKPAVWYVRRGGKILGPFTNQQLRKLAATGKLRQEAEIRKGADGRWTVAAAVKGLSFQAAAEAGAAAVKSRDADNVPAPIPGDEESLSLPYLEARHKKGNPNLFGGSSMKPRRPDRMVYFFTGIIMVASAGMCYFGASRAVLSVASSSWPTVKGRIVTSNWVPSVSGKHEVEISYVYQVDGTSYTCDRCRFGGQGSLEKAIALERYRVGTNVNVFYKPNDPAIAVLEPGISYFMLIVAAAGLVGVGFMLLVWYFAHEQRNPKKGDGSAFDDETPAAGQQD